MRSITVLVFACACVLASGYYMTKDVKYADQSFLVKQKAIFNVLQHVHQNEPHVNLYNEAKSYKLSEWRDHFTKPEVFDEFYHMYEHGHMLPINDVFSIMNEEHRKQAISVFHFFYYARDWETFYKAIVFTRFHLNKDLFTYSLTVALLHRKDMEGIVLPAPYEINPHYFFNTEVIQRAQLYKMQGFYGVKKVEETYNVVIPANYTGYYVHTNPEQKLSYYTEDIGLNSYYYYFHADYPYWMGGDYNLFNDRRGEYYVFQYQQFLARYYLERLTNGLGEIPEFSWTKPIETGYYPALRYYNGDVFPSRFNHYLAHEEPNFYVIEHLEDFEFKFREICQYGYVTLPGGKYVDIKKPEFVEWLGNYVQGNPDSKFAQLHRYFEFAKTLLGASIDRVEQHKVIPSVLEHFETAMRDPVFYQLYKKLIRYFFEWQKHLPHYTHDQLKFEGVRIESAEIEKLVTYFDKHDSDITNSVDVEVLEKPTTKFQKFGRISHSDGYDVFVKARQYRLNHLPFTFTLKVSSDVDKKAVVKVFIGPKYDEYGQVIGFEKNRENMYELDHFYVDLVAGKNEIVRKSEDFSWFVKDRTPFYELYKNVMLATEGEAKFPLDMTEAHCGFPMRLMLPKGRYGGMPFQFFFFVAPYQPPKVEQFTGFDKRISCGVGTGARYVDNLPFGYPFDRPIDEDEWLTPNMYYYDVNIFHKKEKDINAAH